MWGHGADLRRDEVTGKENQVRKRGRILNKLVMVAVENAGNSVHAKINIVIDMYAILSRG